MLAKLLKFELGLQSKQIGFWFVVVIMFIFGFLTPWAPDILGSSLAGEKIKVNGAQMIAGGIASWDIAAIFFTAIFVVTGILRDKTHNMLEIIHGTPVSTFDMTSSRMIGIYLTVLMCIFSNTFGQFIGQFNPKIDQETLGSIRPLFYLQPMVLFTVFNGLVVTAFFTLIAGMTQNRMLVFVSAIGLFFYSIMAGVITEVDVPKWFQASIDPFANIAYAFDTEYWTPEQRNEDMLPVFGYVGLNRLLWGSISLLTLASVFGLFKRGLVTGKTKSNKAEGLLALDIRPYHNVDPKRSFGVDFSTFIMRTKFEYLTTVKSVPFIIMAALAAMLFAILIIGAVFLSPQKLIPTSQTITDLTFVSFLIPVILIIVFFGGEIIWRDKTAKFTELLDSTAVKNWPLMLGKWAALAAVIATFCLIAIAIGMIVQVLAGGVPINVGLYFKSTFLNEYPIYISMAILALFVQSFAPNRIVGMLLAAATIICTTFLIVRLPFYNPLMSFNASSPGQVSEISPYGNWIRFRWFNFYFVSRSAIFAVISIWLWRRGLQSGLITRIKNMKQQITPVSGAIAALFMAGFIGSGIYIHKAYDKVEWRNLKQREKLQVRTEKLLIPEYKLALPKIQSVEVHADLYPSQQEALIKGSFVLENTHDTPITEVYISPATVHEEDIKRLEITGAKRLTDGQNLDGDDIKDFEDINLAIFKFDPPLAPGAQTNMYFETFFHAPRLADGSVINKNWTFMSNENSGGAQALPVIGIPDRRMRNPDKRRKYDLPELEKLPKRDDLAARQNNFFTQSGDYIDLSATVCTDLNQTPIAPGDFIAERVDGNRRCRDYKSDKKILNFFSFLSGDYDVAEDSWTDPNGKVIPIRVYHNENHTYSVQSMIEAVKFSLEHYTDKFGPYQYNYVRIMEVPFIGFAQAFAGTIPFSEGGFVMDSGDADDSQSLDNASWITIHEMGHQWFAHQITPAQTIGGNVLSEGLTSYAALDAYEALYGFDKARYALEKGAIEEMQVFALLDRSKEVPLALAGEQQYLVYNKADWVLWGLKGYIGPEKLHTAMQSFIEDYGSKGPPYPTTLQLIDYLKEVAGPDFEQLITDQWDRITWWELAYGDADISVTPNSDGSYKVSIPFKLDKKISTEDEPKQISVTEIDGEDLSEWIEVGFYNNEPKDKWSDWISLEKVRVTQSESTLSFDVKSRPNHIALDPRRLLQERNVEDNVKKVTSKVASNP
ncbi:MAG: M1 family aminopeptidase [Litorimonas sp.]